ncbi:P-loop containing nucleoside triphosphate hydrolase protein, partial [Colletotrichum godetiae]
DTIRGWRTAANYNQLEYQIEENNKRVATVYSLQWEFYSMVTKAYSLMDLVLFIGFGAGMLVVINLVLDGRATPGDFFTYPMYWIILSQPLERLRISARDILKKLQEADEVRKLLERKTKEGPKLPKLEVQRGELEFRNVTFRRGKQTILEDFSHRIPAGTKTAFVGPSGVGKSTLLALVTGQENPDSGEILIDNQNIEEVDIDSLREYVGIVEQDPFIFNCSVKENLKYAKRDATDEQIQVALQEASLDGVVSQRPKKYDTPAGANGRNFSGGEKQRLNFGRLFLNPRSIVLIDEGTSALDAETEWLMKSNLVKALSGKTCIFVAHRLSSIMDADEIVLLGHKGRIVEKGTHRSLLDKGGEYWKLWQ